MLYLDCNATSPYSKRVQEYIKTDLINDWANPSSEHDLGYSLMRRLKQDRKVIADFLNCSTKSLFFVSGATEATSTILSYDSLQKMNVELVISSPLEHPATIENLQFLESKGIKIQWLEHDSNGVINFDQLKELCSSKKRTLVSLMHANNETGAITDIQRVAKICKQFNQLLHVDCVQTFGKIPLDLDELYIDFGSFSGHKLGSLKGVGLLYAKDPKQIVPLIKGGHQESGVRAGTYNFAAIHSLRLAVEDVDFKQWDKIKDLRDQFETELLSKIADAQVHCREIKRVPNTSNIYIPNMNNKAMMLKCSSQKIFISTGSACSSGLEGASYVISKLKSPEIAASSIRISLTREFSGNLKKLLGVVS